jgi:hypothetical protein
MRSQAIRWLIVVAALALAAALYLTSMHRPASDADAGTNLYPGLQGKLNDVTEVRISTPGPKISVTLVRSAQGWQVAERASFPADSGRVRELLLALAKAKTIERKTAVAANFPALGVEDVEASEAKSKRIDLSGAPVALLVGKAPDSQSTYVRKAGETQSWQVDVALRADADPKQWLESKVLELPAARVKSIETRIGQSAPWSISRAAATDTDFQVTGVPRGRELSSPSAATELASMLTALQLDDVRATPAASVAPAAVATLQTFDGLTLRVEGLVEGEKHFVRIQPGSAGAAPEAVRAEAARIERLTRGFDLEIPAYKYSMLFRPLDALLVKK